MFYVPEAHFFKKFHLEARLQFNFIQEFAELGYFNFKCSTMPGLKVCVVVWWCGGVVVWWWFGGVWWWCGGDINELTNSHVTVVTWIFWFILTLTLILLHL